MQRGGLATLAVSGMQKSLRELCKESVLTEESLRQAIDRDPSSARRDESSPPAPTLSRSCRDRLLPEAHL